MPQHYRSIKKQNGRGAPTLSFSHCYIPALEVGGDFFHVFPLPNNRVGIFICDVMGHGVRAAMITALVRAVLEELRPRDLDAGEFMETVNKRLRSILVRVEEPFLATAFYAVADPAHSELRFANAGHPPSVRLRPGSGKCDLLAGETGKSGPGLGLFDEARYPTETSAFEMGDRVVFYTDGAFEVDSPTGEEFGKEALLAEFGKYSNLPAADLFAAVLDDVKRFSERSEFDDDVCLVVCERTSS
jgi:phosphoserine phosphatase RsbU/P